MVKYPSASSWIVRGGWSVVIAGALLAGSSCSTGPVGPTGEGATAVLVGAGDIGWCGSSGTAATATLLDGIDGTVFTTGDNAYMTGSAADFTNCYDPFWGRHRARTRPSPGNHDYESPDAAPYFAYYGANAGAAGVGYYSYDLGAWHIVSLNSNIPMTAGSVQDQWLRRDLTEHPNECTLAYWHHPRFSSSQHGNDVRSDATWRSLFENAADVVLSGHDHVYERFAPQTPDGIADTKGIRQFTVGTGGALFYDFPTIRPNSESRVQNAYGVLRLVLKPHAYDWEFVTPQGVLDSGSGVCRTR